MRCTFVGSSILFRSSYSSLVGAGLWIWLCYSHGRHTSIGDGAFTERIDWCFNWFPRHCDGHRPNHRSNNKRVNSCNKPSICRTFSVAHVCAHSFLRDICFVRCSKRFVKEIRMQITCLRIRRVGDSEATLLLIRSSTLI